MRQRPPGSGRKSKGPRDVFTTRLPTALGDLVRADAERVDLSYSDYMANLVAEKYGFPLVAEPKNEDHMKLSA